MQMPRLFGWLIATLVLLAVIGLAFPQQLPVSLYKVSLLTLAGVAGYWLDRSLFPYARPDRLCLEQLDPPFGVQIRSGFELAFAAIMLRRAVIVGCAMLAIGLGA